MFFIVSIKKRKNKLWVLNQKSSNFPIDNKKQRKLPKTLIVSSLPPILQCKSKPEHVLAVDTPIEWANNLDVHTEQMTCKHP